jgi:hypothetical protein
MIKEASHEGVLCAQLLMAILEVGRRDWNYRERSSTDALWEKGRI